MLKTILFAVTLWAMVAIAAAQSPTPAPSPSAASSAAESPQVAPTPDAQARPLKLRISQSVAEANLLKRVQPEYPAEAKAKRIEGDVVLKVTINIKGEIEKATLFEGESVLGQAALDAVKKWKYKPFLLNGQPVNVETTVKISFHLPARK
jgi:TonB family protein